MTRHLPNAEGAPAGYIELEAAAPWERGPPPDASPPSLKTKNCIVSRQIAFAKRRRANG
jgi:hypothetical protein